MIYASTSDFICRSVTGILNLICKAKTVFVRLTFLLLTTSISLAQPTNPYFSFLDDGKEYIAHESHSTRPWYIRAFADNGENPQPVGSHNKRTKGM